MINLEQILLFDGGFGTMLQAVGFDAGYIPEELNLSHPDKVYEIHAAYAAAGADYISTNTFGASRFKMRKDPRPYIEAAVRIAKNAAGSYGAKVALDIGPLGALMEPFGEMSFDEAYANFSEIVSIGTQAGADLILIETMSDLLEAKAAFLAARENSNLPIFVTMTFGEDGKTFIGTDPKAFAVMFTSLGADAIGVNCSLGPEALLPVVNELLASTHLPVIVQPNAGIPRLVGNNTVFDVDAEELTFWADKFFDTGVSIFGGCCGTTPEHISAVRKILNNHQPGDREASQVSRLCGWNGCVECGLHDIYTVGELINPTGRRKLTEALREKNWDYVAELAIEQTENGADFLVVNAGLPDIDVKEALSAMVLAIQKVSPLPLVIDCSDPDALECALRVYRGRPMLNSVNGNKDSLNDILPLAVKYGTGLIVLALDEEGIKQDAQGRSNTGFRVAQAAQAAGVAKHDIFIDCLALAAAVDPKGIMVTAKAIEIVAEHGYRSVLGVSNVSYGLPDRDPLNCAFLASCLSAGLNIAIVTTGSRQVMNIIDAARVLIGEDEGCARYIERHKDRHSGDKAGICSLGALIAAGRKNEIRDVTKRMLEALSPLDIINEHIMPSLDKVGEQYENGTLFLPQLMASAEAVKIAFDTLNDAMPVGPSDKGTVVLATVRGDIHDIGKNIVKMLLENYGYRVLDLGKDVSEDRLIQAVKESDAKLVGLSALMTSTAQNMESAISALREAKLDCAIMIGGAVVNEEFAARIGADYYAKDAAQSARIAGEVFGK